MTPSIEQLKWRHILITTLLENLDNEVQYEMKVQIVMVNNSIQHQLFEQPPLIKHKKTHDI